MEGPRAFFGGLPWTFDKQKLLREVSEVVSLPPVKIQVVRGQWSPNKKTAAFVTFACEEDLEAVIQRFHLKQVQGEWITCQKALPKGQQPAWKQQQIQPAKQEEPQPGKQVVPEPAKDEEPEDLSEAAGSAALAEAKSKSSSVAARPKQEGCLQRLQRQRDEGEICGANYYAETRLKWLT